MKKYLGLVAVIVGVAVSADLALGLLGSLQAGYAVSAGRCLPSLFLSLILVLVGLKWRQA
jgi:hypothetical protein